MRAPAWRWRALALALACAAALPAAQAALFEDDEARKAILDLRNRLTQLEQQHQRLQAEQADSKEQLAAMRRSVLELNNQLELVRGEMARLRGAGEQALRDVSELQRTQRDANQNFDDRLRRLEPQKVTLDGQEFDASPAEKRAYDEAIAAMRGGNFDAAAGALAQFEQRYPSSGYLTSARFWLGNALYGKRDYKGAITAFRAVVQDAPDHPKAPEALLALANSQAEMKDTKAARRSIEELLKAYPQSEAAAAGKDRLKSLK